MGSTVAKVDGKTKRATEDRFATAEFPQTRRGLYVCGINWGGADDDEMAEIVRRRRSFFSDDASGRYPYRDRILKWFELWDHPMARTAEEAGDFEKSVSQTNWLRDRSRRSEHRTEPKYLLEHVEEFLEVVSARDPKVIFLFGSCLGSALERGLRQPLTRTRLAEVLGQPQGPVRSLTRDQRDEPKMKVRIFAFENCRIICFPHPTGAKGLTNAQIARYKPDVQEALDFL